MNEPHLRASDYVAAALTPLATLTLAEINAIMGILGGFTGFAYLLWKWRREARRRETNSPFYDRNARRTRGKNRQRNSEP